MSKFDREYGEDYKEASYHAGKGMWLGFKIIIGLFLISLVLGGLSMLVKPAFLYGDRIITKTSFQYTEGKMQEMLTMQTDYAGLGSRIAQANVDNQPELVQSLEIQRAAIKNQLCIIAQMATTQSAVPAVVRGICGL